MSFQSLESFEVLSSFEMHRIPLGGHVAFVTSPSLSAVVQETSWELECQLLSLSCSAMGHCHSLEEMTVLSSAQTPGEQDICPSQKQHFLLLASVL